MKKQKKLIIFLAILLVLSLCGLAVIMKMTKDVDKPIEDPIEEITEDIQKKEEPDYSKEIELWDSNYKVNKDYKGQIYFESGLISLPFVQAKDNETYYRTNWQTNKHDEEGSVFMDYRCDLDSSQNIIIYGHNVERSYEASGTHMFTPLHTLEDEDRYEENRYIDLLLEEEIRRYEIVAVYYCGIYEEEGVQYVLDGQPSYYYPDYTEEEFAEFVNDVKENSYYDTGVTVDYEDSLLTLQTCTSGTIDKFLVLAKLVDTTFIR